MKVCYILIFDKRKSYKLVEDQIIFFSDIDWKVYKHYKINQLSLSTQSTSKLFPYLYEKITFYNNVNGKTYFLKLLQLYQHHRVITIKVN